MKRLQSQSTSNINSITQKAAIPALLGEVDDEIEKMRVEFEKRRDLAIELIEQNWWLSVIKPKGALSICNFPLSFPLTSLWGSGQGFFSRKKG